MTRRQTSRSGQPFALRTDGGYGHAGHESPAASLSSATGSLPSPGAPNFDHVALPPPLRDARDWHEQGVQTSPALEPSRPVSRASSAPAVKVIAKPPTLTPPPALNFESVPVQWRGMTLETAQWTLTSAELQEIVSRAIRRTAQESFIRLLPVKALDEELDAELVRLETVRLSQSLSTAKTHDQSIGESDGTVQVSVQHAPTDHAAAVPRRALMQRARLRRSG